MEEDTTVEGSSPGPLKEGARAAQSAMPPMERASDPGGPKGFLKKLFGGGGKKKEKSENDSLKKPERQEEGLTAEEKAWQPVPDTGGLKEHTHQGGVKQLRHKKRLRTHNHPKGKS